MWCHRSSINHAVSRVPSTSRARTIEQHLNTTFETERDFFETVARTRQLVQSEDRKCSRHDPTHRIWEPRPAELVWIEANVAVGSTKLPLPKPIRLPAGKVHEPCKALHSCGYGGGQVTKGYQSQGSYPSTLLDISDKGGPASIWVLSAKE